MPTVSRNQRNKMNLKKTWLNWQLNRIYLQNAETFEGRGPRLAQVVDEKFQLELSRVGCAKADAPGKVGLNPGTQWNNPNLFDNDWTWELDLG